MRPACSVHEMTSGVADLWQWRRSVTLDATCALLADVQTLVDIPPRIQKLVRG